jgi:uncharacterized protein YcbK (DUF882 family)
MSRGFAAKIAAILLALTPAMAVSMFPRGAEGADVATTHVVTKGQTLEQIAKKYGVSVKSIVSANKLKDPSAPLKAGTKLAIPSKKQAKALNYEKKPEHPGRVTLVRFGTKETQVIQAVNKKGKLLPGVIARFSRMMRFEKTNPAMEHKIDALLIERVAKVSDHFGGRSIEIISGFRPKTPTQYTPHSNHNLGRAIDMRIAGVPNEVVRDYCRTFEKAGVGYYPNSLFVHFDVRNQKTFWIDLSGPGEAPKYVGKYPPDIDKDADDLDGVSLDSAPSTAAGSTPPPAGLTPWGQ